MTQTKYFLGGISDPGAGSVIRRVEVIRWDLIKLIGLRSYVAVVVAICLVVSPVVSSSPSILPHSHYRHHSSQIAPRPPPPPAPTPTPTPTQPPTPTPTPKPTTTLTPTPATTPNTTT